MSKAPLHGLLDAILPDPACAAVIEAAGSPVLALDGPVAARPLVVAALAVEEGANQPVLAITA
ncbi:MAG: hypothetical protein M3548_11645, partial [Actinomycetota bacterium]|nr:hypothetical protein [Actinomycetota bacterium]